jgi:hypothetical protein
MGLAGAEPVKAGGGAVPSGGATAARTTDAGAGAAAAYLEAGRAAMARFHQDRAANATAVVDAAIAYGKARDLVRTSGDEEALAEVQSSLFWCKKQMDMTALKDYLARKGTDSQIGIQAMDAVAALQPAASEAQTYLDRASGYAKSHPADHLQVAVVFLEVAERFPGTTQGTEASRRALAAQEALMKAMSTAQEASRATRFTRAAVVPGKRQPLPDATAQKDALDLIRKTFAKDYARRDAKDRRKLARRLIQEAANNRANPAVYHGMLQEAIRLAQDLNDYEVILDGIEGLGTAFDGFDAAARKRAVLTRMTPGPVTAALLKLLDDPADPGANVCAGRWFAFSARNWDDALPMLRLGTDQALATVAKMEADKPAGAEELLQVGDAWYAVARTLGKDDRPAAQERSLYWYQKAVTGLAGLTKDQCAKRIAEIDKSIPFDPETVNWATITPGQWDKAPGKVITVKAKDGRTDAGVLKPGQRMRLVPHPADTWTYPKTLSKVPITCGWKGDDRGRTWGHGGRGAPQRPYGVLLARLDGNDVPAHGVVTGPGKLSFAPHAYEDDLAEANGAIRVKLVPADEE